MALEPAALATRALPLDDASPTPGLKTPRLWAYAAGSLATQVAIASVGAALPALLEHRAGAGPLAIGWTIAILPLFGLLVQPLANAASDRLRSAWGRRRPFLAAGAVLGALGLAGMPTADSLPAAVGFMALTSLGFVCVDGPYRASTSEAWPGHETLVSSVQALVKGLGTLLTFALVAWLGERAFAAVAAIWMVSTTLAMLALRARPSDAPPPALPAAAPAWPIGPQARFVAGVFLAWFGLQAVTAFVVSFIVHDMAGVAAIGSAAGQAATRQAMLMLGAFALTAMALALPMGRLAQRFGRSRTLCAGLLVLAAGYGVALVATQPSQAFAFSLLGGIGFAALQVLPFPLLLETVQPGREGRLSSLYSVTIDLAQLTTMVACGWLIAQTHSYRVIFAVALVVTLVGARLLGDRRPVPVAPEPLPHPLES
jgi:MFS family permease